MLNLLLKNPGRHLFILVNKPRKELENNDIEFVPAGTHTPYISNLVDAPKPHNSTVNQS